MPDSPLQRADARTPFDRAPAPRTSLLSARAVGIDVPYLDAAIERFMLHAADRDQSPKTVRNYRYSYRNFRAFLLDPSVGPLPPADRIGNLDAWAAWNRRRQLSRFTVNMHWRAVRAFFNYLEAAEAVVNPFRGVKAPGVPSRPPKALGATELRRILRAAESGLWPSPFVRVRTVAIIATLTYTGLRKSELLQLRNGDVDLTEGWVTVRAGKGRFGGTGRAVPIPRVLAAILAGYKAERARRGLGPAHLPPEEASSLSFFVSRSNRPLSESQFRRTIAAVRRLAGVRFSAHVLRHSYVTMSVCERNVPLPLVQAAAGHARLETTAGYIRVRPEDVRRRFEGFTL